MLQSQTILQHFYKLLMWQILISSNIGPLLASYLYLSMFIWKLLKPHQQFIKCCKIVYVCSIILKNILPLGTGGGYKFSIMALIVTNY